MGPMDVGLGPDAPYGLWPTRVLRAQDVVLWFVKQVGLKEAFGV